MSSKAPAMTKLTSMREAFFQAYQSQKGSINKELEVSVLRHLKSNCGRIFHRKGFFVTRTKQ